MDQLDIDFGDDGPKPCLALFGHFEHIPIKRYAPQKIARVVLPADPEDDREWEESQREADRIRGLRESRKAAGLCIVCAGPNGSSKARCVKCREEAKAYAKARRAAE